MSEVQGEEVDFVLVVKRAELYSGNNSNARSCPRLTGSLEPIDGIVVGEREGRQPALRRSLDHSLRRECPVRGGRVSMQVDMCRPARLWIHCS